MIRFHPGLADLMVPKATIRPHPENPNNGDVDEIVRSLLTHGCYRPIIASERTGHILAGHHLYAALLDLGCEMVPVVFLDVDEAGERRILFDDNWIARLAKIDDGLNHDLLRKIIETDGDLSKVSMSDDGYERLAKKILDDLNEPLEINLTGRENLVHTITCPNCNYEWVRGQGVES